MVDNNIRIIPWNDENEKKGFPLDGDILASGPLLMQDGKTCDFTTIDREFSETRHPRSAIALTKEGDIMLVWVNGQVVNHPSDNKKFDNKGERKVHNIIAVRRLTNP